MTSCINGCRGAYNQNQIETYNALLKVKSPGNPEFDRTSVKVATCCCCPLKCFQGLAMVASGIVLCPLPCTVCRIHTHHEGSEIHLKKAYPFPGKTEAPWHYKMEATYAPNERTPDGKHIIKKEIFESVKIRKDEKMDVKTSITGYRCMEAGLRKLMRLIPTLFCSDAPPTRENQYIFAANEMGLMDQITNKNNDGEGCCLDPCKEIGEFCCPWEELDDVCQHPCCVGCGD